MTKLTICIIVLALQALAAQSLAQETKPKITATLYDGFVVAGYVDKGGFINFGGPALKLTHKPLAFILGMLPSLRFKEDKVAGGAPKNSFVTPSLGVGLTLAYRHIALQVPLYYNIKTAVKSGRWNAGIGIGYRL